jgi:hypothetical protein
LDSAFDSAEAIKTYHFEPESDFIIKRNLRKESAADWLETAKAHGVS